MGIEILFLAVGSAALVGVPASVVIAKRRAAQQGWDDDSHRDGRRICPSCEEPLPPRAVACRYCGEPLLAGERPADAPVASMNSDQTPPPGANGPEPDSAPERAPGLRAPDTDAPRQRGQGRRAPAEAAMPPQNDLPWTDEDFARIRDHGPQSRGRADAGFRGPGVRGPGRAPRRERNEREGGPLDRLSSRMSAPVWGVAAAALVILLGLGVLGIRMLDTDDRGTAVVAERWPASPPPPVIRRVDPAADRAAASITAPARPETAASAERFDPAQAGAPSPPVHPLEAALSDAAPPVTPEPVFPAIPETAAPSPAASAGEPREPAPAIADATEPAAVPDRQAARQLQEAAATRSAPPAPAVPAERAARDGEGQQAALDRQARTQAMRTAPPPRPLTPTAPRPAPAAKAPPPSPPAATAPPSAAATPRQAAPAPSSPAPAPGAGEDVTAVGELVVWLQGRLSSLGYYSGPINGRAGPETSRAILAYQRGKQLTPTGRINEALIVSLRRAGSEPVNESRR